jgi:glycosyltransferase involved in cell wall biosynthesis
VILTKDEACHIARAIKSVAEVADKVVVVDCYSSDGTVDIARTLGANVIQRDWVNHSTQFNWALTQLDADTDWVLRIDADEVLTPALRAEIQARLPTLGPEIDGVYCGRRMTFQGRLIRHGGVFPVRVLRLFRAGREFADAKLSLEMGRLKDLQAGLAAAVGSARKVQERKVAAQEALVAELKSFQKDLDAAALLELKPDLNDGVLLNIAPLYALVPWKEAERTWQELLRGKYEWSSISKWLRHKGLVKG